MSLTKNHPAFDRWMEEIREQDDLLDQRYAEELYKNRRKGLIPPTETVSSQDEKPAERHNLKDHANDH